MLQMCNVFKAFSYGTGKANIFLKKFNVTIDITIKWCYSYIIKDVTNDITTQKQRR